MKIIYKSLFFLLCFVIISCNLQVEINVVSGNDGLNGKITDLTLANYGFVPYGQTIYSQVRISNPITGCSSIEASESDLNSQIILMVRGDCTFLQKTKQAEISGAKLLIIIDNRNEKENEIIMVAEHANEAHIPTIMIDEKEGEALLNVVQKESVILSVTFPKPEEQSVAYVDFWLDSFDKASYEFLLFAQLNSSLSELLSSKQVFFTPHYVIWYCSHCEESNYTLDNDDWPELLEYCIYKGRYCNPDPDRTEILDGPIKGVNVVEED